MLLKYYEILGLSNNASIEDIKAAYREKAKLFHPDVNKEENAHEKFVELQDAYEYLITYKNFYYEQRIRQQEAYRNQRRNEDNYDYDAYRQWLFNELRKNRARAEARKRKYTEKQKQEIRIGKNLNSISDLFCIIIGIFTFSATLIGLNQNSWESGEGILTGILTIIISIIMIVYSIMDLEKIKKT